MMPTAQAEGALFNPFQSMQSRNEIRREVRRRRRALTAGERRRHAFALARQLSSEPLFRRSRHVAFYLANDGELDPQPLMERALQMGKRCYLPVLSPAFHNRLWFAPFTPGTPLAANGFGIDEPDCPWRQTRPVWALDLVLMPLVAFDGQGNRLGMGGGYYDRTLAYRRHRRTWRRPRLLGIGYELQRFGKLPHQSWDIPLEGVATEAGVDWLGE